MTYQRGFFVARLDWVGMRRPQVVGRVTGQDSHAFSFSITHIDWEFSGAEKKPLMSVHIGKEIEKKTRECGMTVVGLSRKLGCHRTNVYRIFCSPTIDTGVLLRLSVILGYDFFGPYSEEVALRKSKNDDSDSM